MGEIKDLTNTTKCVKKIAEHIRKVNNQNLRYKSLLDFEGKLSEQEKCLRSIMVRNLLFILCSHGYGKIVCDCYDKITDEEKRLGRKLTGEEVHNIISELYQETEKNEIE